MGTSASHCHAPRGGRKCASIRFCLRLNGRPHRSLPVWGQKCRGGQEYILGRVFLSLPTESGHKCMNLRARVDSFLGYLLSRGNGHPKGSEGHTIAAYRRHLCQFILFLDQRGMTNLGDVTSADIQAFQRSTGSSGGKHSTARQSEQRSEVLRSFLGYWQGRIPGLTLVKKSLKRRHPRGGQRVSSR